MPILPVLVLRSRGTASQDQVRILSLLCLALSPLPVLANLHLLHACYQSVKRIDLLMAVGIITSLLSRKAPMLSQLCLAVDTRHFLGDRTPGAVVSKETIGP